MTQIEEIKQKLDIADVVGSYVGLKKAGKNYRGLCPFHSDRNPSLMVSPELQIYKCFVCGKSGDVFSFVEEVEGIEFKEAIKILAEKAGIELTMSPEYISNKDSNAVLFELNNLALQFFHGVLLKHPLGKEGLEYISKKRKLTTQIINDFGLGYAPDTWDSLYKTLVKKGYKSTDLLNAGLISQKSSGDGYIDKYRGRLMFPLLDINNHVVGFSGRDIVGREPKYLNTQETPIFHKGLFVYALNKARVSIKTEGAILVEGYMDVIACHQAGFTNVIGVSGTALTTDQLHLISRYTKSLILGFDMDAAGLMALKRSLPLAESFGFDTKVLVLPAGYKDIDELVQKDLEKARICLRNPVNVYDYMISAYTKKFDTNTAQGKKQVVLELKPILEKISSPVVVAHYRRILAEELSVPESAISQSFDFSASVNTAASERGAIVTGKPIEIQALDAYKQVPQAYLLALLLKAPLEVSQKIMYKLGQNDFEQDEVLLIIFNELKEYLQGRKRKFEIKHFIKKFESQSVSNLVQDLDLWDISNVTDDPKEFSKELSLIYSRVKRSTAKRDLKELTDKIKKAEFEGNFDAIRDLTEKFQKLSNRLK